MGQFAIVISGVGGHGCERSTKDGEHVLGCQRPDCPDCPDCIARECVRRFKRNNITELRGELIHWPASIGSVDGVAEATQAAITEAGFTVEPHIAATYALVIPQGSSVIDDLVTGERHGSF